MDELQAALKIVLANSYIMYFKAQSYRWNVEGIEFAMLHDFFGSIYAEIYASIDITAEHIRIIDGYAPISLVDLLTAGTISEDNDKPIGPFSMLSRLVEANFKITESLNKAITLAEQSNDQGLMNYLAGRLEAHAKHAWMLKSSLKHIGE